MSEERARVWRLEIQLLAGGFGYLVTAGAWLAASDLVADHFLVRDFIEGAVVWVIVAAIGGLIAGIGRHAELCADDDVERLPLPANAVLVSWPRAFATALAETFLVLAVLSVPAYYVVGASVLAFGAGLTVTMVALSTPSAVKGIWRARRLGRQVFAEAAFRPFRSSKTYVSEPALH